MLNKGVITIEIWRAVKNYEGVYEVSDQGRVKSLSRYVKQDKHIRLVSERILKASKRNDGYKIVSLCRDGNKYIGLVHRLVAEAFLPNPENKMDVDHINTIRDDNRVVNLRWATRKENLNNEISIKRQGKKKKVKCITTGEVFESITSASKLTKIPHYLISACCNNKQESVKSNKGDILLWEFA